jgi:quinol-cytochrome oxidoreductase complex cytochrome b subunit
MANAAPLTPDAQAPWFFLWVQQLLKNGDAFFWGVFVPACVLILLAGLPYLRPAITPEEIGSWLPRSGRLVQAITAVTILTLILLTIQASRG